VSRLVEHRLPHLQCGIEKVTQHVDMAVPENDGQIQMHDDRPGYLDRTEYRENPTGESAALPLEQVGRYVDRIVEARAGRQAERRQRSRRLRVERCDVQSLARQGVGRQDARAPAIAEQHDPVGRRGIGRSD